MKSMKLIVLVFIAMIVSSCATGLNSIQEREYQAFVHNDVLVKEKNPTTGALLGILPGFGSFYVREPGLGIVNLLTWPFSVLWDPVSGYGGSKSINYDITKYQLKKNKNKELRALDEELKLSEINNKQYLLKKRKIDQKYDYE